MLKDQRIIRLLPVVVFIFLSSASRARSMARLPFCGITCQCHQEEHQLFVYCPRRGLSALPADVPKHVSFLDFSFNRLQRLTTDTFPLLQNLTHLDLHNNSIREIRTSVFRRLPGLQILDLSGNALSVLHAGIFSFTSDIKILSLGNNDLVWMDRNAFSGLDLDQLDLQGNRNLRLIQEGSFRGSRIRTLILDNTGVNKVLADTFRELRGSIWVLSLSSTTTRLDIRPRALENFTLDTVRLTHNQLSLKQLSFLRTYFAVETLDLRSNHFPSISLADYASLTRTETLVLRNCSISVIFDDVTQFHLGQLKHLDLAWNKLTSLPLRTLRRMWDLRHLYLQGNQLVTLSETLLPTLNNLDHVDLTGMQLQCSCDMAWFYLWAERNSTGVNGIKCGRRLLHLSPAQACLYGQSSPRIYEPWLEINCQFLCLSDYDPESVFHLDSKCMPEEHACTMRSQASSSEYCVSPGVGDNPAFSHCSPQTNATGVVQMGKDSVKATIVICLSCICLVVLISVIVITVRCVCSERLPPPTLRSVFSHQRKLYRQLPQPHNFRRDMQSDITRLTDM